MKTVLLITALVTFLVLPGSLYAVKHGGTADPENLQSPSASDLQIIASELEREQWMETLLLKLKDPDPFVRVEAVQNLGEIQREKSLISVCGCLSDENLYVRAYAAQALGNIGQVDISFTLSKLLPALDDPSSYVRAMMVLTLGELQDKRAVDPIRKLLHDEDESVRGMAAWALNRIEYAQ